MIRQRCLRDSRSSTNLFEFYDYFCAPIGNAINGKKDGREERLAEFEGLIRKYSLQAAANPWNRMMAEQRFPPSLPFEAGEAATFADYSSLFDWYEQETIAGLVEFNAFVSKYQTAPAGQFDA